MQVVTYGPGGLDTAQPNDNVVETRDDTLPPEQVNRTAIEDGLRQGLETMQQIIDAPEVTFTNLAGAQTAMRQIQTAIKAEARQLRRLTRLALGLLSGSD